jgi:hypothetical protein
LVGESQDKLARVFTSFAAVDGAAALRLAESLGFDLVQHEPGLMVIACKEPPMLTTAVSRYASSHGQHRLQWSAIIVDAALLYQNVAASLNWQFEPIDLPALARSRWNNQRVLGLYSECLQVAIEAALEKRIDISQFPRLSILFEVRPVRRSRSWLGTGFSLMTLVLLGISVISLLTNTSHAIFTGTAAFIGVLLTFGAVFVAFYPIYREYIYCKLLNLPFLALESSGRSAREIGDELNRVSLLRVAKPIFNRRLKRQILASEELVASRQRTLSKNG